MQKLFHIICIFWLAICCFSPFSQAKNPAFVEELVNPTNRTIWITGRPQLIVWKCGTTSPKPYPKSGLRVSLWQSVGKRLSAGFRDRAIPNVEATIHSWELGLNRFTMTIPLNGIDENDDRYFLKFTRGRSGHEYYRSSFFTVKSTAVGESKGKDSYVSVFLRPKESDLYTAGSNMTVAFRLNRPIPSNRILAVQLHGVPDNGRKRPLISNATAYPLHIEDAPTTQETNQTSVDAGALVKTYIILPQTLPMGGRYEVQVHTVPKSGKSGRSTWQYSSGTFFITNRPVMSTSHRFTGS